MLCEALVLTGIILTCGQRETTNIAELPEMAEMVETVEAVRNIYYSIPCMSMSIIGDLRPPLYDSQLSNAKKRLFHRIALCNQTTSLLQQTGWVPRGDYYRPAVYYESAVIIFVHAR